MFMNNYWTDFMFQEAMMCETCSPSILSLIHKSLLKFMSTGFNYEIYS